MMHSCYRCGGAMELRLDFYGPLGSCLNCGADNEARARDPSLAERVSVDDQVRADRVAARRGRVA